MARTELFHRLQRLVQSHRAARSRAMAISQWRERTALAREQRGYTRREALLGLAAGATILAMPVGEGSAQVTSERRSAKIAIVGAGIAGLNCALTLADKGIRSTIYEANPRRVGGRMFTHRGYWADGQISEWGGELIDSGHETIQALAARFGLTLDDLSLASAPEATETFFFDHTYYALADVDRDFEPVFARVVADEASAPFPSTYDTITAAGRALDRMSVYDWIESRVPGGHRSRMGQLLDVAYTIEYAADSRDQSALNLVYLLAFQPEPPADFALFGESDERFHIRGGNDLLPNAIARHLGEGAISFGHTLTRVKQTSSGRVRIDFDTASGGKTIDADLVVLALPFAVLRQLDIGGAGFDARKLRAIHQQGRGISSKLQVQFRDRYWRKRGTWGSASTGSSNTDAGYQESWEVSRAQAGASGIINLFTGGTRAASVSTEVEFATANVSSVVNDVNLALPQFERVFPGGQRLWNARATQSLWQLNPLAQLSYSYYRPGQYAAFAGYERVRQGSVLFAGEHTSIEAQGYMEGGAAEGARAGTEILSALGIA